MTLEQKRELLKTLNDRLSNLTSFWRDDSAIANLIVAVLTLEKSISEQSTDDLSKCFCGVDHGK